MCWYSEGSAHHVGRFFESMNSGPIRSSSCRPPAASSSCAEAARPELCGSPPPECAFPPTPRDPHPCPFPLLLLLMLLLAMSLLCR
ncbi:hypothetical protein Mapa_004153 [Marchantia paleacea]|nr:hypothetical protein Mapa_004153 [Marchantia paleacea]